LWCWGSQLIVLAILAISIFLPLKIYWLVLMLALSAVSHLSLLLVVAAGSLGLLFISLLTW